MALPRRFYIAFLLSFFAITSSYLFFDHSSSYLSPTPLDIPFTTDHEELVLPESGGSKSGQSKSNDVVKPPRPSPSPLQKGPEKVPEKTPESNSQENQAAEKGVAQQKEKDEVLRVALVEGGGSHDEVTAAFVHAFANQPNTEMSLYLSIQRYGIKGILGNFTLGTNSKVSVNSTKGFLNAARTGPPPHILISTTCELDPQREPKAFEELFNHGKTFLLCVVHHADRWAPGRGGGAADRVKPWIEKKMMDFVALSSHTAEHLQTESINKWEYSSNDVKIRVFPPLFPVNIPEPPAEFDISDGLSLAMQGDYSPDRRNYTNVFSRLGKVNKKVKDLTNGKGAVDLHLIGHGGLPKVPQDVKNRTIFDKELSYYNFYSILSNQFAVLPAFASDDYYDRKASSSIPAALIAGAPLVASQRLLDAYSYVPKEAVWLTNEGEQEMNAIVRVIDDVSEFVSKRKAAKTACKNLIDKNIQLAKEWVAEGIKKVNEAQIAQ